MSSSYGIQSDGSFDRPHVDDIIDDLETAARQEIGQDVDLSQGSPVKQIIDMVAQEVARQWEALEGVYYSAYYEDAFGQQLDGILSLAGVSRRSRRGATGEVKFSTSSVNASDVDIPSGTEVTTKSTETRPAIPFETTSPVTLDAGSSSVTAPVEALDPTETSVDEKWLGDETNVPANTITQLPNPIAGVDSVTNPNATGTGKDSYVEGVDRETDAELKLRYENVVGGAGLATIDAIESEIFNSSADVTSVNVSERRNSTTGEYGIEVTVLAPSVSDSEIAQAILDSRGAGVQTFGSDSGVATLDDGSQKTERFDRATGVDMLVDVTLDNTTSTLPTDASTLISDAIIRYIGGEDSTNTVYPGVEIGNPVVFDQVFKRVMETQGVVSSTVFIGKDSPGTEQLTDADTTSTSTTSERGVRIEAESDIDTVYVEAQLSGNVSGATRARLLETDGSVVSEVDISTKSAGDWIRFPSVETVVSGEQYDIGVGAEGSSYTAGFDDSPAYPYDSASTPFKITQRYRGDLSSDGTPQATRPNISGVRINQLGESDVQIGSNKAATTSDERVEVTV